jgi:hypothetical protein
VRRAEDEIAVWALHPCRREWHSDCAYFVLKSASRRSFSSCAAVEPFVPRVDPCLRETGPCWAGTERNL